MHIVAQQVTVAASKLSPLDSIQVRLRVMRDEKRSSKRAERRTRRRRVYSQMPSQSLLNFAVIGTVTRKNDEVRSSRRHYTHFKDAEQMIDSSNGGSLL